ncbi:hypothetical protein B1H18_15405 [Streptomyces tsukubensis]|uniref:Uncharacterized protein n=2 Tax=Streptomyces tsukubensis TaxID=83656 RepID=A0A1V4A8N2_9ACTN|nr:hypothetical protein B1H18_15405 [Streptomyces tsukubensis]
MEYRTGETAGRGVRAVVSWVRRAPGTYLWLTLLFGTTVALRHMTPGFETEFLRAHSTNVHELAVRPVAVLVSSTFWLDGGTWSGYAVLYTVLHAPAEHRLGTLRWLGVAAGAHVLATLFSQALLVRAVHYGYAPESSLDTVDVGVSYALAGVAGVATHLIARPWRYMYLAGLLAIYLPPLWTSPGFTDVGHVTSVGIGLACRPLTRGHGPAWDPLDPLRHAHTRRAGRGEDAGGNRPE